MFNRRQERYYLPLCLQFFYSLSRLAHGNLPGKSMNARPDSLQHQSFCLWHPEEEEQGVGGADHRPGGWFHWHRHHWYHWHVHTVQFSLYTINIKCHWQRHKRPNEWQISLRPVQHRTMKYIVQYNKQYNTKQDNMRTSQTDEEYPRPTDAMFVVL